MVHPTVALLLLAVVLNALQLAFRRIRRRPVHHHTPAERSVLVGVFSTGDSAIECVRSAFAQKRDSTNLRVMLTSYAPMRDLPPDLAPFRNSIFVEARSFRSFVSELHDRDRFRHGPLWFPGCLLVEVDELCVFGADWDVRVESELRLAPSGAVLTTCPSRALEPNFAALQLDSRRAAFTVSRRMDHEPPTPVPSLAWCGAFACSATPWPSGVASSSGSRDAVQTLELLRQGRPMLAPRCCPVAFGDKSRRKIPFTLPDDASESLVAQLGMHGDCARAQLGLTQHAGDAEQIAKYGSSQVAQNKRLALERRWTAHAV